MVSLQLCVLLWTIRLPIVIKCLLQTGHSCGWSCVWKWMWFVRLLLHLEVLPHMLHWWGFSWERNVTWHARFDLNLNNLPHIEHWCLRSEWETLCVIKLELLINDLPQILQMWAWWFQCKVLWLHRLDLYLKHFPHIRHCPYVTFYVSKAMIHLLSYKKFAPQ